MLNVLNLALKKDVFEGLQNGTTNEILIDGSRWWKKRLMNLDTGRFKDFDVACVSSGSSDKVQYPIDKIEMRNGDFIITVINDYGVESKSFNDDGDSDSDIDEEPTPPSEGLLSSDYKSDDVDIDDGDSDFQGVGPEDDDVETAPGEDIPEIEPDEQYKDLLPVDNSKLISAVSNLFNRFCEMRDVYVVNMPNVTIRNNGQIFGCKKRLVADRESDVMFEFTKKEFVKSANGTNTMFIANLLTYMTEIMKNNYVFVNKNASGFREGDNGNLVFVIIAVAKKKYFFAKK